MVRVTDAKLTKTRLEDVGRLGKLSKRLYFNNSVGPDGQMLFSSSGYGHMAHFYWGKLSHALSITFFVHQNIVFCYFIN